MGAWYTLVAMADEQPNLHDWKPLVEDLKAGRDQSLEMGGAYRVDRQRVARQAPVRERLDMLFDPGTFVEYGHAGRLHGPAACSAEGHLAADGWWPARRGSTAAGWRWRAYDFTVMAGSMGAGGEQKTARMRELAPAPAHPDRWLLDSAGARIQATSGRPSPAPAPVPGAGDAVRRVPQVAAMLGHCAAGTAYIPALADFIPMVKGPRPWPSAAATW